MVISTPDRRSAKNVHIFVEPSIFVIHGDLLYLMLSMNQVYNDMSRQQHETELGDTTNAESLRLYRQYMNSVFAKEFPNPEHASDFPGL